MILRAARFIGLLFLALALGISFSMLIGGGNRADLSGTVFHSVHSVVYQDLGKITGLVEPIALIAVLLALLSLLRRRPFFIMTLIAFICIAAMIGLRILVVRPIYVEISSWAVERIPESWTFTRNRYYLFNLLRAGFAVVGFCALSLSVLFDTPPYRVNTKT
jgi:uncharacterized membrane protein YczE